jgi:hypothetical protein
VVSPMLWALTSSAATSASYSPDWLSRMTR